MAETHALNFPQPHSSPMISLNTQLIENMFKTRTVDLN